MRINPPPETRPHNPNVDTASVMGARFRVTNIDLLE
jgi:hypothetical protein